MVTQLVLGYFVMNFSNLSQISPVELEKAQIKFWKDQIGIVAPHNAQSRLIIRQIYQKLVESDLNILTEGKLMQLLRETIFSVEKFQGSARDFIIASIGISAIDQLIGEEDFIYNLNRFNVLSSRARAKFILISSQNYLTYIPNDQEAMQSASKIRRFALNYCSSEESFKVIDDKSDEQIIRLRMKI